jgi:hypothetical protein
MAAKVIVAAPDSPFCKAAWQHEGPRLREIKTEDTARLFINERALPRVVWTPSWRMAEGVANAADILGSCDFDATRECVIDRDSEGYANLASIVDGPRNPSEPAPAVPADVKCSAEEIRAEKVLVHVSAPQAGIVVLADTFAPGWRATLDGAPCPILRANGLFRGVPVSAGVHEILFEYRPATFVAGMAVSLATIVLTALTGLVAFLRS